MIRVYSVIDFLNLKKVNERYISEIMAEIEAVMSTGHYILGSRLNKFEAEFAAYCKQNYCIGVDNGLNALKIILKSLNIGPNDEVIVAANTYIATWLAVSHVGATIVPVDADIETLNINLDLIKNKLSHKTKAILITNLYGMIVDTSDLFNFCEIGGLKLIVDAAQSHGGLIDGEPFTLKAHATAFSFYPTKNLGAMGDAGAIVTDDMMVFEASRMLRNYGSKEKYVNSVPGYNSRMDEIQAAILSVKLKYLEDEITVRSKLADQYIKELSDLDLIPWSISSNTRAVWHLFPILSNQRYALQKFLLEHGIGTEIHYPIPPYKQDAYCNNFVKYDTTTFPISDSIHDTELSLPMNSSITAVDVKYICKKIRQFYFNEF